MPVNISASNKFPKSKHLLKHADFQRVYQNGRRQFTGNMTVFFLRRPEQPPAGPRVGFTVGKVLGGAVDRNRIKRRMREAVRKNLSTLTTPVDVILHPRRSVIDLEFTTLDREVAQVFRTIQKAAQNQQATQQAKQQTAAST
jgi:ribonuclease P protein component